MVISTAVKKCAPFKNLIVNGIVLAEDGSKMSKSKRITLIQCLLLINLVLMLVDFIFAIHLLWELSPLSLPLTELKVLSETYSFLGSMLTDSWFKIFQDGRRALQTILFLIPVSKRSFVNKLTQISWINGLLLLINIWSNLSEEKWIIIDFTMSLNTCFNSLNNSQTGMLD